MIFFRPVPRSKNRNVSTRGDIPIFTVIRIKFVETSSSISYRTWSVTERLAAKMAGWVLVLLLAAGPRTSYAQNAGSGFLDAQLKFPKVAAAWKKYNDSMGREFYRKYILYPPKEVYIRVFKAQNELELWARNTELNEFRLVKTFRICALSGIMGPKRFKGDRQVPEGFYFIDQFNPTSEYCLSLQLNFPNGADKAVADGNKVSTEGLGGDIFIHGGCVTVGCIPITDEGIKQLYVVCLGAAGNGQEYIPVHIFPTRFTKSGWAYLKKEYGADADKIAFWTDLKEGYEYFEKYHVLMPVMYGPTGRYVY
jgi:murein L,D-transpeptidase YafK